MSDLHGRLLPERTVYTLLSRGVAALLADLAAAPPGQTVLDDILQQLDSVELGKARAYFAEHPPQILQAYARTDSPFPLYAITLTGDNPSRDFVGVGELDLLDILDEKVGREYRGWVKGVFTIFIYAEHPDVCAWYYRILRRICLAGFPFLISRGLDDPEISGAELAPVPEYTPENLFVRRVTLSVSYEEIWSGDDALFLALNAGPGIPEEYITDPDGVDVRLVDVGGGIDPSEPLD